MQILPRAEPLVPAARRLAAREGPLRSNAALWAVLLPVFVFLVSAFHIARSPVDNDYWWHVTTGRWMLDHGRIPFHDPFSYTHLGQTWYAHEWLTELIFGIVNRIGGYAGNILVTAAVITGGAWCIARAARYYGAGTREALLLVAGAGFYLLDFLRVRPQVWGWALLALLLCELAADDNGCRRRLWHLPLLFALWINVHLTALLGGGVLALYVGHRFLVWAGTGERRPEQLTHALHLLRVAAVCALALLCNPRGPALIWFARTYLNPHAERLSYVVEYFRPAFAGADRLRIVVAFVVVLITLAAMAIRQQLWPGLLLLGFGFATTREIRFEPLLGMLAVPVIAWDWRALRNSAGTLKRTAPERRLLAGALLVLLVATGLIGLADRGVEFRRRPNPVPGGYPTAALAWIKANVPTGAIFNEYGWGGYVIAQFYPQPRVVMDGREEMYGESYFEGFVATVAAAPGWQQALAAAHVTATLLSPTTSLARQLAQDPAWRLGFADSDAEVFVPAPSTGSP